MALVYLGLIQAQHTTGYRCPPCNSNCHTVQYENPGDCPVCAMPLIKITNTQFKGYDKEEVVIQNGGIRLNAAYYTPQNNSEIQGVLVVVHGSAPSTYEDVTYYTRIGTKLVMAVLAYDKRGVGKSEGRYQFFSVDGSEKWFNLLASDALACVSWLKNRPELGKAKLGLVGGSQAGWIMPLAASKNDTIKFIIIGEGVAVSAGEEHYFSQLTGDGDVKKLTIAEAHSKLQYFKGAKGFDPRSILKNLKTKTLWILGTKDPVIPVDATINELKRINNPNFQIQLLEYGNHDFVNTKTRKSYDLLDYLVPWLTEIGVLK
ncbi:prolyl oligopeptidase family serine peptidase [Ulvibacterium marinum]|nr:prolyl oligopeptidase family serine peptidase [Ulvibacterium marinum]